MSDQNANVAQSVRQRLLNMARQTGQDYSHPVGHHPLVKRGFYEATTDTDVIKSWWTRWPDAAIGLRTGQESGIFAIDIDPRHHGDISLEMLEAEHGPLPETVESQTGGGGRHLLLAWPGRPVPCSVGKGLHSPFAAR